LTVRSRRAGRQHPLDDLRAGLGGAGKRHPDRVEDRHLGPMHRLRREAVVANGADPFGKALDDGHTIDPLAAECRQSLLESAAASALRKAFRRLCMLERSAGWRDLGLKPKLE